MRSQLKGKAERLYLLAQAIAFRTPKFFDVKGAGTGDHATAEFMAQLRKVAVDSFGQDYSETKSISRAKLSFDFHFPDEETVVEVALGLRNPNSEYEHDIFKCLLAREDATAVKRLLFIAKPGALARQNSPGQKAIKDFVLKRFGLEIQILELEPNRDWK